MHSVCPCSLPVWRRSFLKKGTPVTYFCPALDPPLGGSGRKTTTLVRDHEYFIPTKFHQNPSSGSGEEVENVKSLRTDGRTDDGRTDDGRCAMTIAHSSLRLRWAKNDYIIKYSIAEWSSRCVPPFFMAWNGILGAYWPICRCTANSVSSEQYI